MLLILWKYHTSYPFYMRGRNPLLPLQMIEELALHDAIFWFPKAWMDMLSHPPGPRSLGLAASSVLHNLLSQFDGQKETVTSELPPLHPSLFQHAGPDKDVRRRLYLAAAMTPFKGITYLEKKKPVSAMEGLIRVGLKVILSSSPRPPSMMDMDMCGCRILTVDTYS
jgi:tRNA nucleotidyltransferase (CCA-adding enzyme)